MPKPAKPGHDQSYSDLGGYECYPDCKACRCSPRKCSCGANALDGSDKCGPCLLKSTTPPNTYLTTVLVDAKRVRTIGRAVADAIIGKSATYQEALVVLHVLVKYIEESYGIVHSEAGTLDEETYYKLKHFDNTPAGHA